MVMFSAGPHLVPAFAFARSAWTPSPWARTAWCRSWFSSAGGSFSPGREFDARRLAAHVQLDPAVPHVHERVKLVEREEVLDAVAQLLGHVTGVVREGLGGVARLPALVLVLQRLRQVPVVERGERRDARGEQLVHQPVVEVEALRVRLSGAVGEDPRPGDGEPVRRGAQVLHQLHVLLVAVVVVVGDVAGGVVGNLAGRVRVGVPDRLALAVLVGGALDLVRGRGDAPKEACREGVCGHRIPPPPNV